MTLLPPKPPELDAYRDRHRYWPRRQHFLPSGAWREGGKIKTAGVKCLGTSDAVVLEKDVIHSLTNPLTPPTGVIRIYGSGFWHQAQRMGPGDIARATL
jgi:hypothetical protein